MIGGCFFFYLSDICKKTEIFNVLVNPKANDI